MADITFPSNPTNGQEYLAQSGFVYVWNSSKGVWNKKGNFVRPPKVLTVDGYSPNTSGIITQSVTAAVTVGVDSYKAYTTLDSFPNYTEYQFSTNSGFTTVSYATTTTARSISLTGAEIPSGSDVWVRARQFVGSSAASAPIGGISTYSRQPIKFTTASTALFTPSIVSIAADTDFPAYNIGFGASTLPATATYTGAGSPGNLRQVDWRVTGPRIPSSTGDTALAEVGIGTFSSATLANALVLAMPFSGASGVGIRSDVNNAIRTASGASAGTTKTVTANGNAGIATIAGLALTSHFYNGAAYFDGNTDYLTIPVSGDSIANLQSFTIECWVYIEQSRFSSNLYNTIFRAENSGGTGLLALAKWRSGISNKIYFEANEGTAWSATDVQTLENVSPNTWYHVAAVRNNNMVSLYLNGVLQKSLSTTATITAENNWIVSRNSTEGHLGYIQDLKIYKGLAKYQENFTPPLPTYGTISYTTGTTNTGINTTAFFESTGDVGIAETSSTASNALVLAMPMNRTFGFQDINVAIRGLTSGASAGTAKTVGLGTTSTANAPSHPRISSTESKWYDGAGYFDGGDYLETTVSGGLGGTGNYTIEFWYHKMANSGMLFNSRTGGTGSDGIDISYDIGVSRANLQIFNNSSIIPLNAWTHIALVRDSGTHKRFINGILDASTSSGSGDNYNATLMHIGGNAMGGNVGYLTGYMQDFKVYSGFAKYTANFTPPQPICGFTTDISTQTGFTTTTATGSLLSSVVGLGSTSTLAFSADQTYAGVTSITSSSGITTLPDPYAQNLVLALPLANITGTGGAFTNDRNTQIRTTSLVGGGTTKTITNSGVTTSSSVTKWYNNTASFNGSSSYLSVSSSNDFTFNTGDFTIEAWCYRNSGSFFTIFDHLGATGSLVLFSYANDVIQIYSNAFYSSGTNPGNNVWFHLACVRNSQVLNFYINGIKTTNSPTHTVNINATAGIQIGRTGASEYSGGYVTDLKIYKGLAKYTTNFTPPPPMFGDYTRSTPNKVIFTPASDYVLEVKNTSTNSYTTAYSSVRQWGTLPKGQYYDPYRSNLVLAVPFGSSYMNSVGLGQYRYWRLETYDSSGHFPRSSRLILTDIANTDTTITTFTTDNCADSGTIPTNGTTYTYDFTNPIRIKDSAFYSTYNGGQRQGNLIIYGSNDNSTFIRLGSGVADNAASGTAACGVIRSGTSYFSDYSHLIRGSGSSKLIQNIGSYSLSQTSVSKYYGRSLRFSTSYAITNSTSDFNFGTNDFTIECWVYLLGYGRNGYNHYFSVSNQNTFAFKSYSGNYYLYANSTTAVDSRTAPVLNQWNHLALVRRGTTLMIFVNGILDGIKYDYTASLGATASGYIGRASDTTIEGLDGYMNDLQVYNGVAKYTSNFTPPNQIWFS